MLDVGCGTGTFACALAAGGFDVVAVDPARASLELARQKTDAAQVRWLFGDATTLPPLSVDIATMTGNVAQVFLADADWSATLASIRSALKSGGHLLFETREPSRRGWTEWTRRQTFQRVEIDGVGAVQSWEEVTDVNPPFVTFDSYRLFEADGAQYVSPSTLRFRDRYESTLLLQASGYEVLDVRDAPDRPGRELVFIARSTS